MKILIVGGPESFAECQAKFGASHEYVHASNYYRVDAFAAEVNATFDFLIDQHPDAIEYYDRVHKPVFLNSARTSVVQLLGSRNNAVRYARLGFNGLPSLFNKTLLEVSLFTKSDDTLLRDLCVELGTDYKVVDDRVGLVTPRVICMIINEAYYTVQEGTATREDIDIAMKLGTNYPFGPFEWCQRIGIKHVYETLAALYQDTKDERYKICPLLKSEYLRSGRR
jgi:3-hydroxybutyryl-CoA dehydrogenase